MIILLFGVAQVGKSSVAQELANKLNFKMIDIDYYIIDKYDSVEKFQEIYKDDGYRFHIKTDMLLEFCKNNDDIVIPVSPIYSLPENLRIIKELPNAIKFNLVANENTIFKRCNFYDEKGIISEDSYEYKMAHKLEIINGIRYDNLSNDNEYKFYEKIDTTNLSIKQTANEIIRRIRKLKNN